MSQPGPSSMRLLSVIVSHDRCELTRVAVASYKATVAVPHTLIVVDNGSTDDTAEYLDSALRHDRIDHAVLLGENRYPGAAVNLAWEQGQLFVPGVTHLHRSDNDVLYLPGWCSEVQRTFHRQGGVGQVGLMLEKYEQGATNVGGNCVVALGVWKAGVRWREESWPALAGAATEDTYYSHAVTEAGYRVARVEQECIRHLGWDFDAYPDYYRRTAGERELGEHQLRAIFQDMSSR
jgi:glycosyltransferase involved in cell wall biosynthesis